MDRLWLRGGFPRSYLAESDEDSLAWRNNAIGNHVAMDLPQFGVTCAGPRRSPEECRFVAS